MTHLSSACIAALQHYARDRAGSISGKMGVPNTREAMERGGYFDRHHPERDHAAWPDVVRMLVRFGYLPHREYDAVKDVCLDAIGDKNEM